MKIKRWSWKYKLMIMIVPLILVGIQGCSSLTKGIITPKVSLVSAEGDLNAVKGDILPIKGEVKLTPQVGVGNAINETKTSVGGNQTISNDSQIMKDYISAIKEGGNKQLEIMWLIVKGLLALIVILSGNLFFVVKSLLRATERDDTFMETLLNKKG